MAELGELCLWGALPLGLAAAVASLAGALGDRDALRLFGGRTIEATFGLVLVAVAGLIYALVAVQLKYSYVASVSGFQEAVAWRVAGLWSGPAGGLLLLTLLVSGSGAISYRLGPSRRAGARTGCLAVLTVVGLSMVLARVRPFEQPPNPAAAGAGLPSALKDLAWHVEMLATYAAVACSAFAFAGVVAGPLVGRRSERRHERAAVVVAAALMTLAIFAATWRAYRQSGVLFESRGFSYVLAYVPTWLLAYSSLHAPGGVAVPTWVLRWRRMLEFAFFPCMLGAWAAGLLAAGGPPEPQLWAGGLAVGIVTAAVTGAGSRDAGVEALRDVPGYGPWAFRGALLTLALGGVGAVASLSGGSFWVDVAWALGLLGLVSAAVWAASRPAGAWRRVWVAAAGPAAVIVVGLIAVVGREGLVFALMGGLAFAIAVGAVADAVRVARARRHWHYLTAGGVPSVASALRRRTGRRRAAAVAHLGLAVFGLGIAAEALTSVESGVLYPGEALSVSERPGRDVRVTYLGLSHYQANDLDKRVATFKLERGQTRPELVSAEVLDDRVADSPGQVPAVRRGALYDIIVSIVDLRPGEGVQCRLSVRPLTLLVWLGGALVIVSALARWSRVP